MTAVVGIPLALTAGLVIGAWLGAGHVAKVEEMDRWLHQEADAVALARQKMHHRRQAELRRIREALTVRKALVAVLLAAQGHVIDARRITGRLPAPAKRRVPARQPIGAATYHGYLAQVYKGMNR